MTFPFFGAGPAFGCAQNDHGPARAAGHARPACFRLGAANIFNAGIQCRCHGLMHGLRFFAFYKIRCPAVAFEQVFQLVMRDAREHGGVGNLVPVQVQNRQDGPVVYGVQELVTVPRRGQRAGFGLAIAHHGGHNQIGVVIGRAKRMRQAIAQLAAFVN